MPYRTKLYYVGMKWKYGKMSHNITHDKALLFTLQSSNQNVILWLLFVSLNGHMTCQFGSLGGDEKAKCTFSNLLVSLISLSQSYRHRIPQLKDV